MDRDECRKIFEGQMPELPGYNKKTPKFGDYEKYRDRMVNEIVDIHLKVGEVLAKVCQ
jgi:hypothetical protein